MPDVSMIRLYVLRVSYLIMTIGIFVQFWPNILHHPVDVENIRGALRCALGTVGVLALIGIRYPLKMLPVLFFELIWKSIWVLSFGLPRWRANVWDADTKDTWNTCVASVIFFLIIIPWGYVWRHWIVERGDPWRRRPA